MCFASAASVIAAEPSVVAPAIELRAVPVPVQSYRLLSMTQDDDGFIWTGSIHRSIHRYDPKSGEVKTFPLPYDAVACSCMCVGKKVYVLGQGYPKLITFDRVAETFAEFSYPTAKPDVWFGVGPLDGNLFLFDRNGGVVRWDTQTDSGVVIPWPYEAPFPLGGRYEPRDGAIWGQSFDLSGGKYVPLGLSRFDLKTNTFTGWYPYPKAGERLKPFADADKAFFMPETLHGKLIPFDFAERRWCEPLDIPGYGDRFGFIGLGTLHRGRWYFSLSTYDGDETGCDGKPYHFVNGLLEFDPQKQEVAFPTLEPGSVPGGPKDAYYQVAYTLSAGGEFFATGANIREPDGTLNQAKAGEVVFWQTLLPARPK
jgi:hypothetical protein